MGVLQGDGSCGRHDGSCGRQPLESSGYVMCVLYVACHMLCVVHSDVSCQVLSQLHVCDQKDCVCSVDSKLMLLRSGEDERLEDGAWQP